MSNFRFISKFVQLFSRVVLPGVYKKSRFMCDKSISPCSKKPRLCSALNKSLNPDYTEEMTSRPTRGGTVTAVTGDEAAGFGACRVDSDQQLRVIQSPNDKRQYRVITLRNGLRGLLVSDLTEEESLSRLKNPSVELEDEEEEDDEEEGEEDEDYEVSEEENEEEDYEDDCNDESRKKRGRKHKESEKLAAAGLCIGSGSFSDPDDIPGLAHFLEHMVFMGSEKYPEENSFDAFINKHGGTDNAYTDCERTVFYFEIDRIHFREALDRFAQFFIGPLMKKDSVDREIQAVDSEFMMSKVSDTCRKQQLFGAMAEDGHPMSKFFWGNTLSLKKQPVEKGIDVYGRLQSFYQNIYSSHYMTVVVIAKETLDDLQNWVTEIFADVPHNGKEQQTFHHLSKPFKMESFNKLYKVVPIKDLHEVEVTWVLPAVHSHYRSKPLHYISWLVGHEGKGSLLSYLKSRYWALSISSGNGEQGFEYNQTCSFFTVTVKLSDKGFQRVYEVLTAMFQYLDMLRRTGPCERVFKEIQTIEDNEFRWKEQSSASDYVQKLCENMQLYPPQHYLMGDELLLDYDPKVISFCQDQLSPERANIMLLSTSFKEEYLCTMTEPWFGTKYTVCDIEPKWLESWKDLPPCDHFHLPETNEYIATDFTLKLYTMPDSPEGVSVTAPVKLVDCETNRLWFKADTKFKVPKAYLYFILKSPLVKKTAESQAMFELFERLLTHNLSEVAYAADVAQLNYELLLYPDGLDIRLNGFNHKLQKLFETIVNHIVDFTIDEDMFMIVKQQLIRSYFNRMIKADHLSKEARFSVSLEVFHSSAEKHSALHYVTIDALANFVSEYRRNCYVEGFIHGNYTAEEAISIHSDVVAKLNNELCRDQVTQTRVINLPKVESSLKVRSFNQTDPNSSVINYYQHGPGDLRDAAVNELLEVMMEEPCFNYLRTQEQLGYTVYSQNLDTEGIIGILICVQMQATKFSTAFVDSKIRDFLSSFSEMLNNFTEEQFQHHVSSLITLKCCEDMYLGEEASRHWSEIRKQRYLFHRLDLEISELSKLTLEEVQTWFNQLMIVDDKKKLSIQIVGCETEQVDGAENSNTVVGDFYNIMECSSDASFINDLDSFKSRNGYYPVSSILPKTVTQ